MSRLFYIFYQLKFRIEPRHYFVGLGLLVALTWLLVLSFPDDNLHLVFCNVGQGDAILISRKFNQVLIDGGPNDSVLTCLSEKMPFWDRKLEVVVLTHPQSDHLTGLLAVLARYKVEYFLLPPAGNESAGYSQLVQLVKLDQSLKIKNVYQDDSIKLGGLVLKTLWPEKDWALAQLDTPGSPLVLSASTSRNLNDFSLVFHLKFGDFDALLTGDADLRVQDEILAEISIPQVEVLKVPHHGSKYAFNMGFLEKVKPQLAVISVGRNSFGHPSEEVIKKLRKKEIKILRTDQEGSIEIVSDGQRWGIVR